MAEKQIAVIKVKNGEKGDKPAHQWQDSSLRFQNPDGSWGNYTDLKGPEGNTNAAEAIAQEAKDNVKIIQQQVTQFTDNVNERVDSLESSIAAGQGTIVKINSAMQHEVNFTSDPQTQLNQLKENPNFVGEINAPIIKQDGQPVYSPTDAGFADFNSITKPGMYRVTGNINAPVGNATEWNVFVGKGKGSSGLFQLASYYSASNNFLYFRKFNSNGIWIEWSAFYTTNNKPTAEDIGAISKATEIPAGANLNDYMTEGFYFSPMNVNADTMNNLPIKQAFSLLVEKHAGYKQTFTVYWANSPRTWIRNFYITDGWGTWKEVLTEMGGTLTGSLTLESPQQLRGSNPIGVYIDTPVNSAQGMNMGSLLVSNSYGDRPNVPTNGIHIKGAITKPSGINMPDASDNYISAGNGYSAGSGKDGLKLLTLDQFDATMGFGVDLTGNSFEHTIVGQESGNDGVITFAFKQGTTGKTYKRVGSIDKDGALKTNKLQTPGYLAIGNIDEAIRDTETDKTPRYIAAYGKTGASYINFGYSAETNNCGEIAFHYKENNSTENFSELSLYGGANHLKVYPGRTESSQPIFENGQRVYSPNNSENLLMDRNAGIPQGADLNNYISPGIWMWERSNHSIDNPNAPIQYGYGTLKVERGYLFTKQTLTTQTNEVYIRQAYVPNKDWSAWVRVFTEANILNYVYPVGSIYTSVNSTNPGSLFGGNWTQLQDRFLLGAGEIYRNGSKSGAATVTLETSQIPSHTHSPYTDITNGNYSANCVGLGNNTSKGMGCIEHNGSYDYLDNIRNGGSFKKALSNTGGGSSHENMPPYLVVYMWRRDS